MELSVTDTPSSFERRYIPEPNSGCWIWLGHTCKLGYGRLRYNGKMSQAHAISYNIHVGAIPFGLELDHTCKLRCCVNPDHLEPVTHLENVRRGDSPSALHARQTHCINGHEFTPENTYLWDNRMRQCRACGRRNTMNYLRRKQNALDSKRRQPQDKEGQEPEG